jgi:peptidoglycan/LPS O-acetylase OafA/YrhL
VREHNRPRLRKIKALAPSIARTVGSAVIENLVAAGRVGLAASAVETNPLLRNLQKKEIPSLYGLRGLAALSIVVWHYLEPWKLQQLFPGPYAVTMFFELSGLLITWLLLAEIEKTGHVELGQFYSRRALRLFPVFYLTWAMCRLAGAFAGEWFYFFYLGDYYTALTTKYGALTHTWSLGVEEKFYLLWPMLLLRLKRSNLIKLLVCVLIVEPLYRFALVSLGYRRYTWFAFDTHLDAIVLGCLIAVLAKQGQRVPRWLSHPLTPLAALIGVFVFQAISDLVIYLLAVILISVICRPPSILNNRVVRYLGLISYSLYLSHMYASTVVWSWLFGSMITRSVVSVLISKVAVAITIASATHFAVERPFLLLKGRLHRAAAEKMNSVH